MESFESIFNWNVATEPSVKSQIEKENPKNSFDIILRLNREKIPSENEDDLNLRVPSDKRGMQDYIAIDINNTESNRYSYSCANGHILKGGAEKRYAVYGGINYINHMVDYRWQAHCYEVEYSIYPDITSFYDVIIKIQQIHRKMFSRKSYSIRHTVAALEEMGLRAVTIGSRRT